MTCRDTSAAEEPVLSAAARLARAEPELGLLVLFGSRARGDHHPASDYDLGYVADPGLDPDALAAELRWASRETRVDLVDLSRAGALVRFRAAAEGRPLFERTPGAFGRFRDEALRSWLDMQPVLEPLLRSVLDELGPSGTSEAEGPR